MTIAEFFSDYPIYLVFFATVLGLIVGSFLNVVIYRFPIMMQREWQSECRLLLELEEDKQAENSTLPDVFNLAKPDSHCPKCNTPISALENIPVISWLLQQGKCKHCANPISIRYPIIESITALLTVLVAVKFGFNWLTLTLMLLTWCLVCLTMIDFDHQLLPDDITLPILWLGLLVNSFDLLVSLKDAVWGAIAGYLILWLVYWAFKLVTGKEGMGYGDFKLLAALGAWMGWQSLPMIILLSSFVGAIVGISLILFQGKDRNTQIPFGPYLASAGYISLIWGEQITEQYYRFMM